MSSGAAAQVDTAVRRGATAGLRLAAGRLLDRRVSFAVVLGVALSVTGALIERQAASLGAVDRALGGTFRLVVPLGALALASRATTSEGLTSGAFPLARYGAPRWAVALGTWLGASLGSALFGALCAVITVAAAHTASAPPVFGDLLISAWIGAAAGWAYAGGVALGSTFFRGRGRWIFVGADFLFGASTGLFGALLPRGHTLALIGLEASPWKMGSAADLACLWGMGILLGGIAALRAGK